MKLSGKLLLFLILCFSFILRIYKVAQVPPGLYWDEAAMALDAKSIALTGKDHHGHHWRQPIYPSWGDYKLPVYILTAAPFFKLIANNPALAIRLPSVIAGTLTVLVIYFLTKGLFSTFVRRNPIQDRFALDDPGSMGLLAALLLAISPWHLQFSRAAFEANLALFFNFSALLFLIKSRDKKKFLPLAVIFSTLGIYTYYSARIVGPLILTACFVIFWKKTTKNIFSFTLVLALIYVLTFPLRNSALTPQAEQLRLSTKNILTDPSLVNYSSQLIEQDNNSFLGRKIHHRFLYQAKQLAIHFADHFSGQFLLLSGDPNLRHSTGKTGVLFLVFFLAWIGGEYFIFLKNKKMFIFLSLCLLFCFLPGAVPYETPHSLRSLNAVIFLNMISAYGFIYLIKFIRNKKLIIPALRRGPRAGKCLAGAVYGLLLTQFIFYLHDYYSHYPSRSYLAWQGGYQEAMAVVNEQYTKPDKIIFTDSYHRPYLYYLLYSEGFVLREFQEQRLNYLSQHPLDYAETKQIGKIEFRSINFDKDKKIKNVLLMATPEQVYQGVAVDKGKAFVKWGNY